MTNSPAAMAITTKEIAAWWTMNRMPSPMSWTTAWTRLLAVSALGGAGGRTMATEVMRAADTRKLAKSSA